VLARFALPEQFQQLPNEVLFDALIDQLIQQTVLGQAMGEMTRRAEVLLDNERRSIIASEKLGEVVSDAVTDEAIAAAYDAEYSDAEPTQEWDASHILVATEDEAAALLEELDGGADFAELARKSTGPSGPNGGALGWFGPGMMVKPFEDAVMGMEAGDVAGPIQTQFGWHVVKLNDARMKGAPALDEVRAEIVAQLENDAVEQALANPSRSCRDRARRFLGDRSERAQRQRDSRLTETGHGGETLEALEARLAGLAGRAEGDTEAEIATLRGPRGLPLRL
jgi:peptidyl-prolyl cis-trans isomerase C